ncbi:MAG: hypothetical protein PHN57_02490 [Candidatus Omnitrophica bacterium]|nr:hypothetical protein [Candidatus Omnitrophota bacterium]
MSNVWIVLRRVLFSMDRSKKNEPKFFVIVAADIKKGMEIREIFYYLDLKKLSYGFISWGEYQHRTVQDTDVSTRIIGDTKGAHLKYRDISLDDFLAAQIQHRVELKFQKPEVKKDADIDREISKIGILTIRIYEFRDFQAIAFNDLLTRNKVVLNRAAVWARPIE